MDLNILVLQFNVGNVTGFVLNWPASDGQHAEQEPQDWLQSKDLET